MPKHYIILSLNHSIKTRPMFWRENNAGYTYVPWAAGLYTEEQVKGNPKYYNDGYNTIAIPLTDAGIHDSGLKFGLDIKKLKAFVATNKHKEVSRD